MSIEEFLNTGGLKFELWILGHEDGKLRILIKNLHYDGDGDSQEFLVKDNILYPVDETKFIH